MLDRERYQKASTIFAETCDLSPHERVRIAHERCGDDVQLRELVQAMLDADASTPSDATAAEVRLGLESLLTDGEAAAATPKQCGPYTLGRLLGRGGMGEVYQATRTDPDRQVALKILHAARSSPAAMRRFRREVASLARLSHPGISQLYEAGTFDSGGFSLPYFAMELVQGEPVTAFAVAHDLSIDDRLELIARICDIVQFAHQQGVIHRDIKPSNVLVSQSSNGDYVIKILDFGIARLLDDGSADATIVTEQGLAIGTPGFMAPEQVRSSPGAVDTRADVYSLGALAYVLLCGKHPLDLEGLSTFDAMKRVLEEDPPSLGSQDARLRGDTSLVIATAMQRERDRRYASAAEFALDLRRIRRHEPVQAREGSAAYLISRFARRHRVLVASACIGLLALAGFATVVAVLYRREQTQRILTEQQRERADAEVRLQKQISNFLIGDTFGAAAPSRKGPSLKVVDVIDDAAAVVDDRFADDRVLRGKVRAMIANLYHGMGRNQEADAAAAKALIDLQGTDVEREVYFSELHRFRAVTLSFINKPDEAKDMYREAIRIADAAGPSGVIAGFAARTGLAEQLQRGGNHAEAQAVLRELISQMPSRPDAQMPLDGVVSMVNARLSLSASLRATGAPASEWLPLLEAAVEIARIGLHPSHPGMLSSLSALAAAYAASGRPADAMPLTAEYLALLDKAYPADHPSVGWGLLSAARTYSAAGRHAEAGEFASRALKVFQSGFDAGNFNVERAAGVGVTVHHAAHDLEGVARFFRPYLLARLIAASDDEREGVINRTREFCELLVKIDSQSADQVIVRFINEDCLQSPLIVNAGGLESAPHGARLAANLARGVLLLDPRFTEARALARTLVPRARQALSASRNPVEDEKLVQAVEAMISQD